MTSFSRLSICLAAVLVFGASTAYAIEYTPIHKAGSLAYTPVCARTSDTATEQKADASTKMRLAFHCRCCGWQNWNGHQVCVHQCCD
jgi:hypothetical protein